MALLFADGFEHYGTGSTGRTNMLAGPYLELASTGQPSNAQARTGSLSLKGNTNNSWCFRRSTGVAKNELGVAVGVYYESLSGVRKVIDFQANTTAVCSITVSAAGAIQARVGGFNAAATIIGETDAGLITASAWHHIETRILVDDVVGEVEIRVNGSTELFLTNVNLGANLVNVVGHYMITTSPYIDDLIVWDTTGDVNNTFFGPARVNTVFMSADTDVDDWSVTGAATGAEAIDETTPDGDTTYVSAAMVGQRSEFVPGELPPETEVIGGVYIPAMAKLASAGLGNFQLSIVSNGEVATGPDYPLTTAYTYWPSIFEKDPDGNKVWSKAAFEAARIRIEKTA